MAIDMDIRNGDSFLRHCRILLFINNPESICGKARVNETFRVVKSNGMRQYGEYRTKRLVLEAWERMEYGDSKFE